VTRHGSSFQIQAVLTGKAQLPTVDNCVLWTISIHFGVKRSKYSSCKIVCVVLAKASLDSVTADASSSVKPDPDAACLKGDSTPVDEKADPERAEKLESISVAVEPCDVKDTKADRRQKQRRWSEAPEADKVCR